MNKYKNPHTFMRYNASATIAEIYQFFQQNPKSINHVNHAGETLIESAINECKTNYIWVLCILGARMEDSRGKNIMWKFIQSNLEYWPYGSHNLLILVRRMMDLSGDNNWNWRHPLKDYIEAQEMFYSQHIREILPELKELVSMEPDEWKRERAWERRKNILEYRRTYRRRVLRMGD